MERLTRKRVEALHKFYVGIDWGHYRGIQDNGAQEDRMCIEDMLMQTGSMIQSAQENIRLVIQAMTGENLSNEECVRPNGGGIYGLITNVKYDTKMLLQLSEALRKFMGT